MKIHSLWLAFALTLGAAGAHAACPVVPVLNLAADGYGGACVTLGSTTYQGTMTLAAATSTSLISANVTMASSTTLPAAGGFVRLSVINVGTSNGAYVCWLGGAASATSGCELLGPGAGDVKNIAGSAAAPTFYSVLGTPLSFSN